jgi:hypothetical protein
MAAKVEPNTLTAEEKCQGWRLLFDGKTANGWVGWKQDRMPAGWQVQDGTLARVEKAGDIVTTESPGDFELALEWKISEAGNSGVFFRVTDECRFTWQSGHEMQIIDNDRHPDGRNPMTMVGSCYALYPPKDNRDWTVPVGEWNKVRIVAKGNHIEYWLNGERIVAFDIRSDDWTRRIAASKFRQFPNFGLAPKGRIALQDHGNLVWFRNIKIRPL